ncbi:YigZ family protein [Metamycoplasma equirhinis]|uniref:YigZ family protein n=1 Tax=Metamycoplasma equirhinis TaxID=92402 RepID=UPI003593CCD8
MHELIIKKSKFLSFCFNVHSKEGVKILLNKLISEHKKANHIVYAFIIEENKIKISGYSDDNEPKGVAGIPIYKLLENKNLTNKAVFVVRYFGGIKLGKSTLLRTYLMAAKQCLGD